MLVTEGRARELLLAMGFEKAALYTRVRVLERLRDVTVSDEHASRRAGVKGAALVRLLSAVAQTVKRGEPLEFAKLPDAPA